jgi:hypothetical protein
MREDNKEKASETAERGEGEKKGRTSELICMMSLEGMNPVAPADSKSALTQASRL